MSEPLNSEEYAWRKKREQVSKPAQRLRVSQPRLMDFPPILVEMAEKLSAWERDKNRCKVLMLSFCAFWTSLVEEPPVPSPGYEHYEAYKLLLQLTLSPTITPCRLCSWPRAAAHVCYVCGDPAQPREDTLA